MSCKGIVGRGGFGSYKGQRQLGPSAGSLHTKEPVWFVSLHLYGHTGVELAGFRECSGIYWHCCTPWLFLKAAQLCQLSLPCDVTTDSESMGAISVVLVEAIVSAASDAKVVGSVSPVYERCESF